MWHAFALRLLMGSHRLLFAALLLAVGSLSAQPGRDVVAPLPSHPVVAPPSHVVQIVIHRGDPTEKLINALGTDNYQPDGTFAAIRVEFCGEFDLTGQHIYVGGNRSLVAAPGCERTARRVGPLIYVTKVPPNKALFDVRGDNVVFSGFRLQGPNGGEFIADGDANTESGILIFPKPATECEAAAPLRHIEISNMEIYDWSGAGVYVQDFASAAMQHGRLTKDTIGAVHVDDSFIHHNRHGDGFGYGVNTGQGGYTLIERTVFDENRHAIAGDSVNDDKDKDTGYVAQDFSGYTVQDNLILPNGGDHCTESFGFPSCWYTHIIDMHGDRSVLLHGEHCCGHAGEQLIIRRNTVLYTGGDWHFLDYAREALDFLGLGGDHPGLAIKIRGDPTIGALIENNVFKHGSEASSIDQNGEEVIVCFRFGCVPTLRVLNPYVARGNVYGKDPLAHLGSCDFVGNGDGEHDDFMATGIGWWAKSSVTHQWRYLNTQLETLDQLELYDLDHDGVCDVVDRRHDANTPPRRYVKSGRGQWLEWGTTRDPNHSPGVG